MTNTYLVGQIVELQDVITDQSGVPVDDGSDQVTVYLPDGSSAQPVTTHSGVSGSGTYVAQFTPTQTGWHEYVFRSTALGAGAGRSQFYVAAVP